MTITDVARAAGVSVATVSRVLNNQYGVAPGTIDKVQAVIDDLGYESSIVARSMRSQRTNVLGIVVMDLEPWSAELLRGFSRGVRDSDYDLIVYSSAGGDAAFTKPGWERRLVSRLNGSLTDGLILVTPTVMELNTDSPVVTIDPHIDAVGLPAVSSDNHGGALQATAHLTGLGHRRIGFIAGRPDLESARGRRQGYADGLAAAGLELDPTLVRTGDYTRAVGRACADELLDLAERPTAIFAANDESAIGVLEAAKARGIAVPDELSVVGFDDLPEARYTEPPLTTVDQSVEQMGYEATLLLLEQIADPSRPPVHITLPTQLVVRGSCRAPLAAG